MIQEDVFTALKSLVGNRVYPMTAPDSPTKPYIVYQRVASKPENTLSSGIPINQTRLQVDIYDTNYKAAQTLAASVLAAMQAAFASGTLQLELDAYEQETKLYRVTHDYSIWA